MTDDVLLRWALRLALWVGSPTVLWIVVRHLGGRAVLFLLKQEKAALYEWLRKDTFADDYETRSVNETKIETALATAQGNTRALESLQAEVSEHATKLDAIPSLAASLESTARAIRGMTRTMRRVEETNVATAREIGRLSGVVDRLAHEWDGRDRRDPSHDNANRRANFPVEG